MMKAHRLVTMIAAGIALVGCGDDTTGLDASDLEGTWNATVYEFTDNADSQIVEDVVQTNGASFTLTVDATGNAATLFDDGLGSTSSDSGTLDGTNTTLTLGGATFDAVRNGNVLTLTDANQSFDFGSGSVPATLRVVMNRS